MTMERTDIHRPSVIDPADYSYVDSFDNNPPEVYPPNGVITPEFTMISELLIAPWREQQARLAEIIENSETSVHKSLHRCDHCGTSLRYVSLFYHEPTGEHITVGNDCSKNTLDVPDRMTLDIKRLKEAAANRREKARYAKETEKARAASRKEYPEAVEILENYEGNNSFLVDVKSRFDRYGNLSEKQAAAVVRAYEKESAPKQEEEQGSPVVEGKITVTGEVKKAYHKETDFGSRFVMIVQDDRGFKVWGTVPSTLCDIHDLDVDRVLSRCVEEGDRIKFSANVTKSDRDESFGFFKRPTKATVIEGE